MALAAHRSRAGWRRRPWAWRSARRGRGRAPARLSAKPPVSHQPRDPGDATALGNAAGAAQHRHILPLVLAASSAAPEGFVRIVNRSARAGTVRIHAIDDTGRRFGPVTLSLDARKSVQLNSSHLERGNASMGLSAGIGDGQGHWRLELDTTLDIEPLSCARSADGPLASLHPGHGDQGHDQRHHQPREHRQGHRRHRHPGGRRQSPERRRGAAVWGARDFRHTFRRRLRPDPRRRAMDAGQRRRRRRHVPHPFPFRIGPNQLRGSARRHPRRSWCRHGAE